MDKKIAVVILNWNGCGMLRSYLPSVVSYSEADGATVYVADNGSTDDSVETVRREFPTVRLITLDRNYGFADGYNQALKQVKAEYVVLLNSDVEVTEHWLALLAEYMDAHPEVAGCQPKSGVCGRKTCSNTLEPPADTSTSTVTPSAEVASWGQSRPTTVSTIPSLPYSGLPVPPCSSV